VLIYLLQFIDNNSLSDSNSFQDTSKWIDDVRTERGNDIIIIMLGSFLLNKTLQNVFFSLLRSSREQDRFGV